MNRRGFDRHASVLKGISELAPDLQSSALLQLAAYEPIQTIVAFPPQLQRGWDYVPRQALLFTPTAVIHVLASIWPGEAPQVTHIRGRDLLSLRITLVLLYGLIEIIAKGDHAPVRLVMEFNTVAWSCLSTPVRQLLLMSGADSAEPPDRLVSEAVMQPSLDDLPLKFSNGVKIHGLLPRQKIDALVFQPAIWRPWLYFFRRKILANTLIILSTDFLVVIQEELNVEQGWVLTYIPRACIAEIQNCPRESWNELTIRLERAHQTAEQIVRVGSETARAWQARWARHGGHRSEGCS